FALCSPITHVIASATLLFPQPFGPTMAVTPRSNASSDRSENDLKPLISRRSRRMAHTTAREPVPHGAARVAREKGPGVPDTTTRSGWDADGQRTDIRPFRPP